MKKLILAFSFSLLAISFLLMSFVPSLHNRDDKVAHDIDASQGLTLEIANKTVQKGEEVCVEIYAKDFHKIVSMQYSMEWDAAVLKFKDVNQFKLPAMNAQNFGTHLIEKGIITFAWYDPDIRGINLPDGEALYQICFEVIGASGSRTFLNFTDQPTIQEISNGAGELIPLNSVRGVVRVK